MEDICRTCLRTQETVFNLYTDVKLMFKIESLASIELSNDPFYPSKICGECVQNVNSFFNFRKVIINSHKELNERYETFHKTKAREKLKNEKDNRENTEIYETFQETKHEDDCVEETEDKTEKSFIKLEDNAFDYSVNSVEFEYENEPDYEDTYAEDSAPSTEPNDYVEDNPVARALVKKKRYECKECQEVFTSRFKLYHHQKAHTKKGVCNICGMIVRTDNLRRHIILHSENPVACKICDKVFKNSESLRSHKRIHLGVIFTCELCGKCFKVKSEYTRHTKTHSDPEVGKVTCSICGKKVRDMKKHKQSHTGERPHPCSFCKKGFTSPYALKVHTRQHTNERPYVCEYCPTAFPQKVSLVTHIKSKHNKMLYSMEQN